MNLGFNLELKPGEIYLTSDILGFKRERLPLSTSRHAALDLARVQGTMQKSLVSLPVSPVTQNHSFIAEPVKLEVTTVVESSDAASPKKKKVSEKAGDPAVVTGERSETLPRPMDYVRRN